VGEYGSYLVLDLELEVTRTGHPPYLASARGVCFDPIELHTLRVTVHDVRLDPTNPAVVVFPRRLRY